MRLVRAALTAGWLLLIISLFWDPITPELTRPDNVASPFHLKALEVAFQGKVIAQAPYQMTNRIFWTMIIPLLPLFLMVGGHEAWRRICPLSFVSQIPRYLGLNRKRSVLIRRTGQVERQLALIGKDSWWRRKVWYIQFGFLFLALNIRILFINSDRTALALFFIGVIVLALWVGYMWGGKTWCNYVCPIAIVQKIYTEPRGLLESRAHVARNTITQSMCRTSTPEGDRSICVGCIANCPDIDLERSYWENIEDPALRHVYYGFFGIIIGFYCFYYFYSGGWDYYFSGAWTHEAEQLDNLLKTGLFINGNAIGVPKIFSAPLILGSFVVAAIVLGKTLEKLFRQVVKRAQLPVSEAEIISRCLSFSAYLSINTFYLFGGRPNLLLLPTPALRLVDTLIVALSTLWFWQAIQRSPMRYRREGLATSLIEQLRKLKVDISKFLDGRKLEELKADEVYVLAKTLPSFSRDQRLQAYRNILEESIRTGKTDHSDSLELLREVRVELGISDDEHRQLRNELSLDNADDSLGPQGSASYESWLRVTNYRSVIEPMLIARLEQGQRLDQAMVDAEVVASLKRYRETYQISESEHANTLSSITGSTGVMFERARRQLDLLAETCALVFGLRFKITADRQWTAIGSLLIATTTRRTNTLQVKLFSTLLMLGNTVEARAIASQMARLAGSEIEAALSTPVSAGARKTWLESLDAELVKRLLGSSDNTVDGSAGLESPDDKSRLGAAIEQSGDLTAHLQKMVDADDPLMAAIALTAISYLDIGLARSWTSSVSIRDAPAHWLLAEVVDSLTGPRESAGKPAPRQTQSFSGANPEAGAQTGQSTAYTVEWQDTMTKLLWLSQVNIFGRLNLNSLAEIAASAEVRCYPQGGWLCRAGDPASEAFVLRTGSVDILVMRDGAETVVGSLRDGAIVGELGVITSKPRAASVRISSTVLRVVTIDGERLRWLMEGDATVAMGILAVVAGYVTG